MATLDEQGSVPEALHFCSATHGGSPWPSRVILHVKTSQDTHCIPWYKHARLVPTAPCRHASGPQPLVYIPVAHSPM